MTPRLRFDSNIDHHVLHICVSCYHHHNIIVFLELLSFGRNLIEMLSGSMCDQTIDIYLMVKTVYRYIVPTSPRDINFYLTMLFEICLVSSIQSRVNCILIIHKDL